MSEDHDKRVPATWLLMMVLRNLNQGRDSVLRVQIQFELCPVEHFYNLGCGMANVTIAHIPLIPEAPPQPAPSRHPSEKQRLLSHQGAGYHCDHHHGAVGPGGHQSPVLVIWYYIYIYLSQAHDIACTWCRVGTMPIRRLKVSRCQYDSIRQGTYHANTAAKHLDHHR